MKLYPVTLENDAVALHPMTQGHVEALFHAGKHEDIWRWTTEPYCLTYESTQAWINTCLSNAQQNVQYPFVIESKLTGLLVGSTSYLNIAIEHKAIEVGYTFLCPEAQKTHINRNCKLLLLSHAFEQHKFNRVALQTHEKNHKSRAAIEGIGAKFEGIIRNCRIQHDGQIRNSAIYSILKEEWPEVKAQLVMKIRQPAML